MINKQNLWFITLFSLILVLSIYYVTMIDTNETLATISENISSNEDEKTSVEVDDSSVLVALRVAEDENVLAKMEELQTILLDETATAQEKNEAYESLQALNSTKGKEQEIEKLIQEEFSLNSFVKITEDKISITIASNDHSAKIANDIILKVQSLYENRMYITIKFQK
ncbi:MAG: SpoIIIAH-like family protein [Bacilli bacterium]|nr:SpoIIIAH-like family protein [Bacilli bacterium]